MINSLIKAGAIWAIVNWLKPRWKKILLTSLVITFVWVAHQEFLEYVTISGSLVSIGFSYFIKWSITILALLYLYYTLNIKTPKTTKTTLKDTSQKSQAKDRPSDSADRFAQIRNKKTLRSKTDSILDKYKSEKKRKYGEHL